jgi:hypothetical protein
MIMPPPASAGNNFTKNSWYPNRDLMVKASDAMKGGVDAYPHDKWLPMEK